MYMHTLLQHMHTLDLLLNYNVAFWALQNYIWTDAWVAVMISQRFTMLVCLKLYFKHRLTVIKLSLLIYSHTQGMVIKYRVTSAPRKVWCKVHHTKGCTGAVQHLTLLPQNTSHWINKSLQYTCICKCARHRSHQMLQGWHSTFWDRVWGPLNCENYQHFLENRKNCTLFKQRMKLITSITFRIFLELQCSLSLRSLKFELLWKTGFKTSLEIKM